MYYYGIVLVPNFVKIFEMIHSLKWDAQTQSKFFFKSTIFLPS